MSVTTRTEKLVNALLALLAFSMLYAFANSSVPSPQPTLFEMNSLEIVPHL